jgi:hypothetical protein
LPDGGVKSVGKQLLSIDEVADQLSLEASDVHHLINTRQLITIRITGKERIAQMDVWSLLGKRVVFPSGPVMVPG